MSISLKTLPFVVEQFNQDPSPGPLNFGGRGKLYALIELDGIDDIFPSVDLRLNDNRFETSIFFMMPKKKVSQARPTYDKVHVILMDCLKQAFPRHVLHKTILPHGIAIALKIPSAVLNAPNDEEIARQIVTQFRGMLAVAMPILLEETSEEASLETNDPRVLVERRLFRLHLRQERNPAAARAVKERHGFECKACGFNFSEVYGPLGADYIEAHHLRPLSTMKDGVSEEYSVDDDFTVLCANCLRMIHRTQDPSNLAHFRALISKSS